ncbi:Uncharacterised protein [Vibrio cholerae]|nr:Uncharacterised protein [Vibrio cholerae]CRZ88383.1 Uncharacterised protein [Vibrio cholerae]CSA08441.1 Uncharacterised protein [Vibrio cholerae]CSB09642.1 Uncharacterised protein [Vibrio cholerae]CSB65352.1 Uncharacterised protein [Vibrio cholerae]
MQFYLTVKLMRQQSFFVIVNRDTRFVTRGFNTNNAHSFLSTLPSKIKYDVMLPRLGATNKPCPECKRQSALQRKDDRIKIPHHFDLAGYRLGAQGFLLLWSSKYQH